MSSIIMNEDWVFPPPEEQIDRILNNFDFGKVLKTKKALNWRTVWEDKWPTIEEMRDNLREDLEREVERYKKRGQGFVSSSGGYEIELTFTLQGPIIELRFCVENCNGVYYE